MVHPPESIQAFYFSGTGNSAKVVEWTQEMADEKGVPIKTINITNINRKDTTWIKNNSQTPTHLLFIGPTHGFNYPPILMHFIWRFPGGTNDITLVNTRAGMRIGQWVTPGLSGIALLLSALVLKLKGYKIRSLFSVDLPSNWLSLHPGMSRKAVHFLHKKNKQRVSQLAKRLLNGEKINRGYRDLIPNLLVSPIAIAYYFLGRFFFAKTFFATSACTHCGLCEKQCGSKGIKHSSKHPFWTYRCESCMQCINSCPVEAIQTGHGYIIGLFLLYAGVLVGALHRAMEALALPILHPVIDFLVNNALLIALLFGGYRVIYLLLRFKWFSKLMEFTSLTRYKFWGRRYKALKDSDFSQ